MPNKPPSVGNGRADDAGAGDVTRARTAAASVTDAASDAAAAIDESRSTAADGLDTAASAIRDRADDLPGGDTVRNVAHATADRLSTSADYVRSHDAKRMMTDVETFVKSNPGPGERLDAEAVGSHGVRRMTAVQLMRAMGPREAFNCHNN